MPGLSHILIGSLLALVLYNTNSQKFTRKHALIFAINSWIGPDLTNLVKVLDDRIYLVGHSYLGFPLFALLLVPFYFFLTRFSFDYRHFQVKDMGPNNPGRITPMRLWFLITGAGLLHMGQDITFERAYFTFFPFGSHITPLKLSIDYFLTNLMIIRNTSDLWIVLPLFLGMGLLILYNYELQKTDKSKNPRRLNTIMILGVGVIYGIYWILGNGIMSDEAEIGNLTYSGLFLITPFICTVASYSPVSNFKNEISNPLNASANDSSPSPLQTSEIPISKLQKSKIQKHQSPLDLFRRKSKIQSKIYDSSKGPLKLQISVLWIEGLGFTVLIGSIIAGFYKTTLLDLFHTGYEDLQSFTSSLFPIFIIMGLILGIFFIITGYKLFQKEMLGQSFARFALCLSGMTLISLVIWAILREQEVLVLFSQNQNKLHE